MSKPLETELFDPTAFEAELAKSPNKPIPIFKSALIHANEILKQRFYQGRSATELVLLRAQVVDVILDYSWNRFFTDSDSDIALIAVGGYGRGELHPYSDIDLQILIRKDASPYQDAIVSFTTFLWDIGLEVGHSVRTLKECVKEAKLDITIATNIQEARLLSGPQALFEEQRLKTSPKKIWPGKKFFTAKWQEQQIRHLKFNDTAYNLEPNIKEGPGGLRDIQMIGWVAKRHFNAETLRDLVSHDFLTEQEYKTLIEGQALLWQIRFGIHVLTGRREDRLLIEHQRELAKQFGYQDDARHLAVEKFMRQYYRTVMELNRLNEMLLTLFQEELLVRPSFRKPKPINSRFQARAGFIEVVHDKVFEQYPFALLEIFLLLAQNEKLKGVRANTIRSIRNNLNLIDSSFRNDLGCQSLFMELLKQAHGITHELRRMNRYGVLAKYLPIFGDIVGLMQHDLFHVYTVDEHTLMVIRNMRRFTVKKYKDEFPLCSKIVQTIPKQELLLLAGLFHDIAKGRGGKHSELGAIDAYAFCQQHKLSEYDSKLVQWLVLNHLIMSSTAQKKDISDPDVIHEFATQVGEQNRLNYIYLLTVADTRATGPDVWNSWKDTLLRDLYVATTQVLRRGLDDPILSSEHIESTQQETLALLSDKKIGKAEILACWEKLEDEYFLRHSANEIAWQMESILDKTATLPIVLFRNREGRGGTELFVYTLEHEKSFAHIANVLEQLGLNIVDARVLRSNNDRLYNSFIILDSNDETVSDRQHLSEIRKRIRQRLKHPEKQLPESKQHVSRQAKAFKSKTNVQFWQDTKSEHTVVQIITSDRPGLISSISKAFLHCDILIHKAKVATYGTRAEDIFYITSHAGKALESKGQFDCISAALVELIDIPSGPEN